MNVMITGASGGLGRAMAMECARRGWKIYLADVNSGGLDSIKIGLERRFGAEVYTWLCDITCSDDVDNMIAEMSASGVRLDMLLNIAGVDFEGSFEGRDREDVAKIVSINDEATLRITHAALELRRRSEKFTVVFVSSLAAMFPMPLKATYAASKRFLLDFSLALRREMKAEKVNTLALCPGGLVTGNGAIKGIEAQGLWGELTTNKLERGARKTIEKALAGKNVYIPGVLNKALCSAGKIVPRSWAADIVYWRWNTAQKKWLD